MWDVGVIGGGPAGSTAARLLAASGISVLLLEAAQHPRVKPCGGALKGEGASGLHVYVMEDQGGPVGYVGVGPERGSLAGHPGEVFMLYVEPGQHGRGFGKKLLCRGLSDLAGRGLLPAVVWVLHDNPARSFYEHMGGQYLTRQHIEIGQPLVEDAYSFTAWPARP